MQFVFFDLEMIIFYNIIKSFYAKEKCIMKKIISMVILLAMAVTMMLPVVYAAENEVDYVFGGSGVTDQTDATTMKEYADTKSGNWCWYGMKWTMDGANAKKRISTKAPETNRVVVQKTNVGDWFALDVMTQPSGVYEVDFTYVAYDNKNAGAADVYFIEKPEDVASVEDSLVDSARIGSFDCKDTNKSDGTAMGTSVEARSKKFENIIFKDGKEYLLVVRTTRTRDIQIQKMHVKKIGDVGNLTEISASVEKNTISVGDTLSIVVSGKDSNGEELTANSFDSISYSSSDNDVATVVDGVITAVANGSATITVTATLGDATKTAELNVIVVSTEKYLFSGVRDTWTKLQGTSKYKTVEGIPYDQTTGGNWAWHSKSTASDNFKVFALTENSRLQVAGMSENDWFAIKIKSPGTGKWEASLEYVAYPTAGKCDVYIIRSCDENEVSGHLKNVNKAGTINFQDETLAGESTKSETLKDFTLYQDREYLVVFKVVKSDGSSNNLRPNQLILTEIPGAEIEEEKEYVSPNASFAETTNIDGFDGITVRSVRRGASVTLTAHKKEIEGYKFVGWKRGADISNANAWVDITGDNYSVWTNTYLTAIYEPITESGDKVVEFWNQNGAYLGKKNENDFADALATTPTLTGFDVFLGWFTDENVELTTSSELKAGTTNAVAQYNASTISGVKHNGVLIDGADTYNASITLDKTSSDTTCWKRDGMIIAYGDTYKFNVWDATNITEGEEIIEDKVPVAILDYSEKHGAYMFEYDAGECEIAEAGIIFGGESIDSCTKKYTSQRKVSHNQFTVPNEDGVSAKGYVIFRQNDGSDYEVKYFSVAE